MADLTEEERRALPEFVFVPREEFSWFRDNRLVGRYLPGQDYCCTRQPRHDALREQCDQWVKEGKIVVTQLEGHMFTVKTVGEVN